MEALVQLGDDLRANTEHAGEIRCPFRFGEITKEEEEVEEKEEGSRETYIFGYFT